MYIAADTLDDLLRKIYRRILTRGVMTHPSKGAALELQGVALKLGNPLARLSRTDARGTLFSGVGEWLWYLSGSNRLDFIEYYLPKYSKSADDGVIYGGYGPRIFGKGVNAQITNVIGLLGRKRDSRQAVVQIFDKEDILAPHKDIPCTCSLQFMIRDGFLDMHTVMRSNDAYVGLPHDVFAFTMIQELVARSLDVKLGQYRHYAASLHLYEVNRRGAVKYLTEGFQSPVHMPRMPQGDPWGDVDSLLTIEKNYRDLPLAVQNFIDLDPYWADIARILEIFALDKQESERAKIPSVFRRMSSSVYSPYIQKRMHKTPLPTNQKALFKDAH